MEDVAVLGKKTAKRLELAIRPYKTPDLLFTSSDLRNAAWAGWYAALGEAEAAEKCANAARQEEIIIEFARRNVAELRKDLATAKLRIIALEQELNERVKGKAL